VDLASYLRLCAFVTKQYDLVPAKEMISFAVRVFAGLVEIYGFMSKLPAGSLSRNWDQLHGRSFHVLAPETGKVCLPTIER